MAQTPAIQYQHEDGVIDYTPSSAVTCGDVILIGTIPMIAQNDIAASVKGSLKNEGVWKVPKTTDTFTAGDAVYWNTTGSPVVGTVSTGAATSTASGNYLMGYAVLDALTGDTYVYVELTAAKRTTAIAGSVTADDITGSDSSLGITGNAPATTSSAGGAVVVAGGIGGSVSGAGGLVSMTGGAGTASAAAGGAASVVGGAPGLTGVGGAVAITGGVGGATSGTGGAVAIAGGAGSGGNANGGAVTIKGGEPNGSGAQGTVTIEGARMAAGTTAAAITSATVLTLADSGGIFTASQAAAYDIDLPSPTTGPGLSFEFSLTGAASNDVTVTVAGSAATFVGILQNDVTGTVPCTGSTLTYKSGVSALGDMIQIRSIATNLYRVYAACSANGGITIT